MPRHVGTQFGIEDRDAYRVASLRGASEVGVADRCQAHRLGNAVPLHRSASRGDALCTLCRINL